MCCEAEWKREVVQDHKWDYVNVAEFHKTDFFTRIKYIFVYIFLLKNVAIYGLDIFTAVTMLSTNHWTNAIYERCGDNCAINVQFGIAKWVFVGCIIFSFVLLAYEAYKARLVILSRDISYAFTNLMANDYYSLKNYDNFCLFCHINNSTKSKDNFAFFIFFTFKGWKRLLLADGPRQSINALVLYSFAYANGFDFSDLPAWWNNSAITAMLLWSMILTVLIFIVSLVLLIVAAVCYIPLLCYIQGNLKEYVCHKVDKRIAEIIKRMTHERVKRNAKLEKKLAAGGAITNSKGQVLGQDMLQPTLPQVALDDDLLQPKARRPSGPSRAGARSPVETASEEGLYPAPAGYGYDAYTSYPPPPQPGPYEYGYSDNYSSSTGLVAAAAPFGVSYPPAAAAYQPTSQSYQPTSQLYQNPSQQPTASYQTTYNQYPSSSSLAGYSSSHNLEIHTTRQENLNVSSYRPPYTRQPTDASGSTDMYGAPQQPQTQPSEPSGLAYDDPSPEYDYSRSTSPHGAAPSYTGPSGGYSDSKTSYQPSSQSNGYNASGSGYNNNGSGGSSGSGYSNGASGSGYSDPNAGRWGYR